MATDPLTTIVEEILVHGADDWVDMPEVYAIVREKLPEADAATLREQAIAAICHVVRLGLMEVGTVTTAGFVGSTETLASFESRLRAEWSVSSPPFVPGEICWLRLTERGAPLAKQALERGGREALTLSGTEDGVAAAEAALRAASAADDEQTRNARLDDAVALLRRATTEKPSAEGLYLLGYAQYLHEGARVPGAVREASKSALREALRLNPRHAAAHLYLGHHAYDEGRYDDARLELELGKLEPTNDELWA